jgi:hypothetical protein
MSKKSFTGGLSSLLGDEPDKPKKGRPKTSTRIVEKASQEGTKEGEIRATFIVREPLLDKLKAIAYWDRVMIKKVVDEALSSYIEGYEKQKGVIKPIPKK